MATRRDVPVISAWTAMAGGTALALCACAPPTEATLSQTTAALGSVEEATLQAVGSDAAPYLSVTVSLSADSTRALLGTPGDITPNGGSARVFLRSGTTWTEEAKLLPADGLAQSFGWWVSLSGDGARALVGALGDDNAVEGGSARVFVRSGGTWTEEATLLPSDPMGVNSFGKDGSLSGDGSRAIVGANQDNTAAGAGAGSAWIFVRSGTTWAEETMLLPSAPLEDALFGGSVSLNDDGSRAVVGSFNDSPGGINGAGSASVFLRSGGTWKEEATLVASDLGVEDHFGASVSLNQDGSRVLVTAPFDDTAIGSKVGSARIFRRSGTTWSEEATLLASDGTGGDYFGYSAALNGEGNLALVDDRNDDTPSGIDTGSARVFARVGTTWTETATLIPTAAYAFGEPVALSADGSRALIGSIEAVDASFAGSARVFALGCAAIDCGSAFCVDGVCCDSECGGGVEDCQACSVAAGGTVDGMCTALTEITAPRVTCRPAADSCDIAETCSPSSTMCPADGVGPACCIDDLDCDDGDPCTTDQCSDASGCTHVSVNCAPDAGTSPPDSGSPDSGTSSDGGTVDAGSSPESPDSSCQCQTPRTRQSNDWLGFALLGLIAASLARRSCRS